MNNFKKVFKTFKKAYILVPLEVFKEDPYEVLISTLLSSRTKDEVTLKASKKLFSKAPNINKLNLLTVKELEKLIHPVGFYKTKAKHLKQLAYILITNYDCKIPKTQRELMELPGVGIKTANLVLTRAFNIAAISVDTHVHKISNLLGWVKTKTPEQTEKELSKILPNKYWKDINRFFVSIGRQHTTKKSLISYLQKEKLL